MQAGQLRLVFVSSRSVQVAMVFAVAVLLSFSAMIRIPLPFSPVPLTLQTLVVLLAGGLLGPWAALAGVGLYLGWGVMGAPFFAGQGVGAGYLLGPTGGYLVGFLCAATLVGFLSRRIQRASWAAWVAVMVSGICVVYLCGAFWLAGIYRWPWGQVLALGIYPFVVGDLAKVMIAASVCRQLR